jgi:cobalt-zinc-cadmium efflux system outer membrane protein
MRRFVSLLGSLSALCAVPLMAQQSTAFTRAEAVRTALERSPTLAAARADTAASLARIVTARAFADPTLSASYTKDIPQYHVSLELPIDAFWLRGIRGRSASAALLASSYRLRYQAAAVALDADTAYTRALAALAHARLSSANAVAADSLRQIAATRRAAGDVSDLEVELATLAAGQAANAAAADSLTASLGLVRLQAMLGIDESARLTLTDSLMAADGVVAPDPGTLPLLVQSSTAALQAATLAVQTQRRARFGSPGILLGFDAGDPTGQTPGLLPTVGLAIPIPLFNRNRGPIAEADAQRAGAEAELAAAELESRVQVTQARGQLAAASARLQRDRGLLGMADRVATQSLTAYREGAAPLATVIEAQRTAREARAQAIDDAATVLVTVATLRLLALSTSGATP